MFCLGDFDRFNHPYMSRLKRGYRQRQHATQFWEDGERFTRSDHWRIRELDARIMARRATQAAE